MSELNADLDRFYALLSQLEVTGKQGLTLSMYDGRSTFPDRGVYFFREPGEYRLSKPDTLRIVRVGTHAVSIKSKSTLWKRLKAHQGTRAGGGNHRGSIFRLHIGAALLARDGVNILTWGVGSSAPPILRENEIARAAEAAHEFKVSKFIGAMTVLWVNVPDEPGPGSMRAFIERNSIALLSKRFASLDSASADWLGKYSRREEIQRSCLWNLNHVDQTYDPRFLDCLEFAVERTII